MKTENPITVEELSILLDEYIKVRAECPDVRTGQSLMNALFGVRRDLFDEIYNTKCDCFYLNNKMPDFFHYIFGQEVKESN